MNKTVAYPQNNQYIFINNKLVFFNIYRCCYSNNKYILVYKTNENSDSIIIDEDKLITYNSEEDYFNNNPSPMLEFYTSRFDNIKDTDSADILYYVEDNQLKSLDVSSGNFEFSIKYEEKGVIGYFENPNVDYCYSEGLAKAAINTTVVEKDGSEHIIKGIGNCLMLTPNQIDVVEQLMQAFNNCVNAGVFISYDRYSPKLHFVNKLELKPDKSICTYWDGVDRMIDLSSFATTRDFPAQDIGDDYCDGIFVV